MIHTLKAWWYYQWSDMGGVVPEHRLKYVNKKPVFHLNSEAGAISFKPKSDLNLSEFRNDIINRFEALVVRHKAGDCVRHDLFRLYADARTRYRGVRTKATMSVRARAIAERAVPLAALLFMIACATDGALTKRVDSLEAEVHKIQTAIQSAETEEALCRSTPTDCTVTDCD